MNNPPKKSHCFIWSNMDAFNMVDAILGQRNWLVQKLNSSLPTILMHSAREGGKFTIWEIFVVGFAWWRGGEGRGL